MSTAPNERLFAEAYRDPVFFCRVFLSHWFTLPMPWVHRGILAIITKRTDFLLNFGLERWPEREQEWTEADLDKILRFFVWRETPKGPPIPLFTRVDDKIELFVSKKTIVMLPRGFSKTTLLNAANIWSIVYSNINFLLYISEAAAHAMSQLETVKSELEHNEALRSVYGNLVSERGEATWAEDDIETKNGVRVACRGRGGQIRGLLKKSARPDRIIFDDVEDEESVKTDEQLQKTSSWMLRTVVPALKKIGKPGEIIGLGNMLHPKGLLPKLALDPSWVTIKFSSRDPDGNPLWADRLTLEEREQLRLSHIIAGNLSGFYLEYDNEPYNEETATFSASMFRYTHREREEFMGVALAVDPAISAKGDYFALAVVGIDKVGRIHVLDFFAKKGLHPRDQIDTIFDYHFRWNPTIHGIEATQYQQALVHLVQAEMFIKGKQYGSRAYFPVTEIKYRTAKTARIKGVLAPRYRSGYVTHQTVFPILESQLIDFRDNTDDQEDDGPDAVAMAIGLLDPYASFGGDEDQLTSPEYKPVEEELAEFWSAP